jgi:hypothetical protein
MYQASANPGWRNVDLPSRDGRGERTANPPLGLNLHYLLSAYGAAEFHAEILLGYAMQLLHETPVLTRDSIRRTLGLPSPVNGSILPPPLDTLTASELADQVETVRLTPQPLGLEEISKLWPAFQSRYRPTAAYEASVVLIESRRSTRSALPVADDLRRIYVVPLATPTIDSVASTAGERAAIAVGSTLAIRGINLRGETTLLNVAGIEIAPAAADITPDRIELPLTSPLPAGIRAGVTGLQVIHRIAMGEPETPHRGVESNVAAFVLRPSIDGGPVLPGGAVIGKTTSTETVDGASVDFQTGALRLTLDPKVGRNQAVSLLLNELGGPSDRPPRAYTFRAPAAKGLAEGVEEAATLDLPFRRVIAGSYLVRIRVDGAESVPGQGASGEFERPRVTL